VIVTVASGKGGTGKTTVATSLALAAASLRPRRERDGQGEHGPAVQLLDCDVEEPNAHLYLRPSLEAREEVGLLNPVVDEARCTHCGRCAEVCAYHALAVLPRQVIFFGELCHGCGSCALNCPEQAIREELRVTGLVETGHSGDVAFGQGTLTVGEAMAVPVIRALKRHVDRHAHALAILDAPPGTACPVVECLRGADYALLVTEPTPFGLHDLKLAVEVARDELSLPVGVVVNRDGVGDHGVDDYCRAEGILILLRIPLDRRIAEATSEGVPLVVALPEYLEQFQALYRRIERITGIEKVLSR
jgi:MinD superfamily P-loop ATPase